MRMLWTLVKVALALVLVVPICIIVLATALGILGTLLGLAILVLRVAVAGLVAWGIFRLVRALWRGKTPKPQPAQLRETPRVDPYYEAAMRELDRDIGTAR